MRSLSTNFQYLVVKPVENHKLSSFHVPVLPYFVLTQHIKWIVFCAYAECLWKGLVDEKTNVRCCCVFQPKSKLFVKFIKHFCQDLNVSFNSPGVSRSL